MNLNTAFKSIFLIFISLYFPTAFSKENNQESSKLCHLVEAQRIISDVIPGEETRAEKMLINCIRTNPKDLYSILELAQLIEHQVTQGERPAFEIHKSLALVSQAYTLAPFSPKVRYIMAHLLATIGQYEEAKNVYEKTIDEFPNSKETWIEKAKAIVEKNPDDALLLISNAVKLGINSDDIIDVVLAYVHFKSNSENYSENLEIVAKQFQNRWLYHKLGLVYIEEKNYLNAAQAFQKSIEYGNNIEGKLQLAILQYQYLKDYKQSIFNFESLLKELDSRTSISPLSFALVYSHYSLALYLNNQKKAASNAAVLVEAKSGGNHDYMKSLIYEYKGRNALFVLQTALEKVTLNDPTFDMPYAILGEVYRDSKNYLQAIEVLNKAIILNSKNDGFYAIRGSVYYKTKEFEKSLKNFESAIELNPGNTVYSYNKACVLALMGKKKESLDVLRVLFNLDKKFLEIVKKDSDFDSIRSDATYSAELALLIFEKDNNQFAATNPNLPTNP